MRRRNIRIILVLVISLFAFGCSGGGTSLPTSPEGINADVQLRESFAGIENVSPDVEILEPADGMTATFYPDGENGRAGIEVRIDGELAAVTDETGEFQLPDGVDVGTTLEYAVDGETFYKAELGIEREAMGPEGQAGDGIVYGMVVDEQGAVPYALVIVTDGDNYAYDVSNSVGFYEVLGAPTGHVLVIAVAELHYSKMKVVDIEPEVPYQLNIMLNIAQGLGKLYGRTFVPGVGLLPGVYVNFTQPSGIVREDISNIYGMYELLDIPAGLGHLYAHKTGYHDINANLIIQPGFNGLDIGMTPIAMGAVVGQVFTPYGYKVIGALVRLTYVNQNGDHEWKFMYTGDQGQFGFGNVSPSTYAVQAFAPGWTPAIAIGTVWEGTIQEEVLVIDQTDETGLLEGWAVDYEGQPVPYAFGYVEYIGFKSYLSGWAIADENGHFEVDGIPYGPYAIHIESAAFFPAPWEYADILPTEDGDFLSVLFPYNPALAGSMTGTVYGIGGDIEPYAIVGCYVMGDSSISYKALADENGHYVFPYLPPTVYNAFAVDGELNAGYGFDEVFTGMETVLDLHIE